MGKHEGRNRLVKKPQKVLKFCNYKIGREDQLIALRTLAKKMYRMELLEYEWPADAFKVISHILLEHPEIITDRMLLEYKLEMKKQLGE